MTVTVVTDSAASIPAELVQQLGIVVVPMSVIIGGTVYPDGQLGLDEVMARVDEGVSTSGTNPGEFLQAIEPIDGDVDRGCLIFQVEQIGAIAHRAGLCFVGIERRHIANRAPQRDLFQMKRLRLVEDLANGDRFRS